MEASRSGSELWPHNWWHDDRGPNSLILINRTVAEALQCFVSVPLRADRGLTISSVQRADIVASLNQPPRA